MEVMGDEACMEMMENGTDMEVVEDETDTQVEMKAVLVSCMSPPAKRRRSSCSVRSCLAGGSKEVVGVLRGLQRVLTALCRLVLDGSFCCALPAPSSASPVSMP